ncbi:MAG: hypothetical protein WAM60_12310, partial [Candidatus Promineifilaceae bacterium]
MRHLAISGFPVTEPEEADPELAQRYIDIKQAADLPEVPGWAKAISASPGSLDIYLTMLKAFYTHISLPQSIVPIILYTIANARDCT